MVVKIRDCSLYNINISDLCMRGSWKMTSFYGYADVSQREKGWN